MELETDVGAIPSRLEAGFGDIAAAAMTPMLEMNLGARVVFAERIDEAVLEQATRALLDLEPVLGCWYEVRLTRAAWVRCTGLDSAIPFSLKTSSDPDGDAAAFHAQRFDAKGPRAAVRLLRTADHDEVCVRLDHTAGDGWSGVEVVHLLAETYSGFLRDPARPVQPRLEPRPTQADVWNSLSEEQRAAAAGAPAPGFSKWKVKLARGTDPTFQARELTLSADRVAAIREYAHARGATINEALIAALLRSVSSISPPPASVQPGVSISADTRRIGHGANLRRIANIATTQTVTMEFVQGESYEQTLRHVADGTRPWRERLWSIGGSLGQRPDDPAAPKPIVLRAMFGLLTWSMRIGHAAALLTMNVGAFDEERVAFGPARPVKVVAMGPIPRFAGFAMYISSYRGAATLWMGYRENRTATAVIERCLAGIDEELALAVPGPW